MNSVGKNVEKLVSLHIADGNVKWWSCCEKLYDNSSKKKEKVNTELPSDLETPFLGIYAKARKAKTWTDGCIFMFMALLVTNNTVHTIDTSRDG